MAVTFTHIQAQEPGPKNPETNNKRSGWWDSTMENNTTLEELNDIADLNNDRIDNLAALITVTSEQMEDRLTADRLLNDGQNRTAELISLVFGGTTPSVENYLTSSQEPLQAA